MASTRDDIMRRWRSAVGGDQLNRIGAGRFHDLVTGIRANQEVEAEKLLDPWLPIFDVGIEWATSVYGSIDEVAFTSGIPFDESRSGVAFLGAACANAVAVRHLVTSGLDSSARVVLRSMVEALHFAIACFHSDEIAIGVRSAADPESINRFWYHNLRGKNLADLLSSAEDSIGLDPATRKSLRDERASASTWLGQLVHPSYSSAELFARTPLAADPNQLGIALIGRCSHASIVTLDFANKALWYFCQIGIAIMERRGYPARIDPESEMTVIAAAGREVFTQLVVDHWDDADIASPRLTVI